MIELSVAGLGLLICTALLLRMVLPDRQRWWVDYHARRFWLATQTAARRIWHGRGLRRAAARETDAAIRRARGESTRDGNVIRPKSFDKPRKPH